MPGVFRLLTPPGPAAIAVVRIAGPDALPRVAAWCQLPLDRLPAVGRMRTASLYLDDAEPLDEVMLSVHAADEVRLHLHGSPWIVQRVCASLEAGGFSPEASASSVIEELLPAMQTLSGVRWLAAQVGHLECVAGLEASCKQRRVLRGMLARRQIVEWFRTPARIAVVGPPNAGKSTLINALVQREACIVSEVPGTTRDWVEIRSELAGMPVTWLDTAGIRATEDPLEAAGIAHTRRLIASADGVLLVLPAGAAVDVAPWASLLPRAPLAVVRSKCDLAEGSEFGDLPRTWRWRFAAISATSGQGLDSLRALLPASLGRDLSQLSFPACLTGSAVATLRTALSGPDSGLSVDIAAWLAKG